jgi:hypothetical protein
MHLQIQPSVDAVSIHPSVFPLPEPESPPAPRTAAATRMRLKHGLYSKHAVIPGESLEKFRDYRQDTILDQQPVAPEEADLVEQMVLAQWQLKRVWATQTGVYERFERMEPAEGESHPERLAQCFLDDCAHEQALDRLSRHYVRLVNIYHKAARKLDLLRDQRRKRLSRPQGVPFAEEEVLYAAPPPAPPAPASEPLAAPQPPAPATVAERAETAATPSIDERSGENADRGGAAGNCADVGADRDPPPTDPPPLAVIDGRGAGG